MMHLEPYLLHHSDGLARNSKLLALLWALIIPIVAMTTSVTLDFSHQNLPKAITDEGSPFFPTQTFTAEYEVVFSDDPRGPSHQRISCNGDGLFIYEWNKLRFLYDRRKQLEFIIDPSEFKVYIHPLRQIGANWLDEEMFLRSDHESCYFKYLGREKLDIRQCRVYGYESQEKRYYDNSTRLLILQKGGGTGRTYSTKLMKYSSQALPSPEFEIPKNFCVIDCTR